MDLDAAQSGPAQMLPIVGEFLFFLAKPAKALCDNKGLFFTLVGDSGPVTLCATALDRLHREGASHLLARASAQMPVVLPEPAAKFEHCETITKRWIEWKSAAAATPTP